MNKSVLSITVAAVTLTSVAAEAQLTVTELNGSFIENFATRETSIAFGSDEILGGTLPIHKIPNVRDRIYGNDSSWIGDSANAFIGINFGAIPLTIGSIAFGRDNNGVLIDRTAGTFTLQYTTEPNPDASTPAEFWFTIGSVTQSETDGGLYSSARRKAFSFEPVEATGVRLITPGAGMSGGAAIDEFEVSSFVPAPITYLGTGGEMDKALNLALGTNGGIAFAKDIVIHPVTNEPYAEHQVAHLNDGIFGNSNSWIGNTEESFAGIRFDLPQTINRIAFGRDNTGTFVDRWDGYYLLQFTRDANPDENTPDISWSNIGPIFIDATDPEGALRHEYSFAPVEGATGIRVTTPGGDVISARGIDELEVYAVPEPASAALALIGAMVVGCRRRARGGSR